MSLARPLGVLDAILESDDVFGVLERRIPVRLVNFSGSGCLLESGAAMSPDAVGRLVVVIGGDEFDEQVRVVRCQALPGAGSVYHVGVQFGLASNPQARSLRRVIRQRCSAAAANTLVEPQRKEAWSNGQPNGERGAPVPDRRRDGTDVGSAARAAK